MFKHPLLYVWIVIVGALVFAANLPDRTTITQEPTEAKRDGETEKTAKDQRATNREPAAKEDAPKSSVQGQDCSTCSEHDKADLYEQRRMAVAAERQVLVGVAGFVTLMITLVLNVIATRAATSAANTASEALKATNRAWVGPETVASKKALVAGSKINAWVIIKNTGITPAREMRVLFKGHVLLKGQEPPIPDTSHEPPKALFPSVPDWYFPFHRGPDLSQADVDAIVAGDAVPWIVGRIDYRDGAGLHRTDVCTRWDVSRRVFVPHETGNEAS